MTSINIPLRPFNVPNFVIMDTPSGSRNEGLKDPPSFPVSAVDEQTLSLMCDDFRAGVFAKAGKIDPRLKP